MGRKRTLVSVRDRYSRGSIIFPNFDARRGARQFEADRETGDSRHRRIVPVSFGKVSPASEPNATELAPSAALVFILIDFTQSAAFTAGGIYAVVAYIYDYFEGLNHVRRSSTTSRDSRTCVRGWRPPRGKPTQGPSCWPKQGQPELF